MNCECVRRATAADVEPLAVLAAETFPLACPPELPEADIAQFIAERLSPERFAEYLADPTHVLLVHAEHTELDGYVLLMMAEEFQPDPSYGVTHLPSAYLSKCYVRAAQHGTAAAGRLIDAAKRAGEELGAASIWLNTNQGNARACRFYLKHAFTIVGTKQMRVGGQTCQDYVFEHVLRPARGSRPSGDPQSGA